MNMVIPDEGKLVALDAIFRLVGSSDENFQVALFTAPQSVGVLDTLPDFTLATFTGSAPITLLRELWLTPIIIGGRGSIQYPTAPSWTMTAGNPETVYGWILWGTESLKLYAGQTFDIPRDFVIGATLTLDPFRIQSQSIGD